MKVIALKPHFYDGKTYKAGDEYEINKQSDANILAHIGQIKFKEEEQPPAKQTTTRSRRYNNRSLTAAR